MKLKVKRVRTHAQPLSLPAYQSGHASGLDLCADIDGELTIKPLDRALVPTGLAMGRVGNFINGELWGRFSAPDLPWGMVFKNSGSMLPRHPSQVYQFLLEGLLLFVLLWLYARQPRKTGQVSGAFLLGYGVFRFIAEFFREPDDFLGILALGMSMGQWLCVPMIVGGVGLWWWASRQAASAPAARA